ncbi:acyl carrier protein [Campylobacter jejuni]|uniref:acyl carrier protein n=1 Tax=Campylobacter TaxID=194 RepID=UPI0006B439C2|nr:MULTISPECIES: acyl carrier protein [Campylobacter]EAI6102773.1 acyl carrier protein [Campylobacter jejuni]EAL7652816.1 acyl carrier protein [Campylobacter jejuni]ECP5912393.1 acyl carrier protein [Campylobacter jejuni]ECQ5850854.1 acyl carrier protein [Campylobacter jejuni]EHD2889929.1 acyl carrier protein [Campylobacter jejuni]
MEEIKQFFKEIGKEDINEFDVDLFSSGRIDSLDIINLVGEIEKFYKIELDFEDLIPENFENFISIKKLIDKAL